MSVGYSSITTYKQQIANKMLAEQVKKICDIYNKYHKESWFGEEIYFLDCSAGDMKPEKLTSPQIFLDTLLQFPNIHPDCRLYLFEEKLNTFEELKANYQSKYKNIITNTEMRILLKNKPIEEHLNRIRPQKYRYGLLYFDPNGFKIEPYEAIFTFLKNNPRVDILLNVNATQIKRNRGVRNASGFEKYQDTYLSTIIRKLHKEKIWIRGNIETGQKIEWIMLFGTNFKTYRIDKWAEEHFKDIDSKEGQKIIEKHNLTHEEKEAMIINGTYGY